MLRRPDSMLKRILVNPSDTAAGGVVPADDFQYFPLPVQFLPHGVVFRCQKGLIP
jgi:hypothetical protein